MRAKSLILFLVLLFFSPSPAQSGPFDVPGIDKDDPSITAWATGYSDYLPAESVDTIWMDPTKALGPASGSHIDIVALGERDSGSNDPPGQITLTFDVTIKNGEGYDFVVFENAFPSGDGVFVELAYVEVSTDGDNFLRFPCASLTPEPIGEYAPSDPTNFYNLPGFHINAYTDFLGTPFDLEDLSLLPEDDLSVDLQEINYIRIIDIPGTGEYTDRATLLDLDYEIDHPIYDPHPTTGSAGFDLEAIGVIHSQEEGNDSPEDGDDTDDSEEVEDSGEGECG